MPLQILQRRRHLHTNAFCPTGPGVYRIKCTFNDKCYVGSAVDLRTRLSGHRQRLRAGQHHNQHLQRAWAKYGEEAFVFEVLGACSPENLLVLEQAHIDLHRSANRQYGYNICPVAGNSLGVKRSAETRKKLSKLMQGWKPSKKMLQAARKANTGRACPKSPEHRAKLSAAHKGKKISASHRAALIAANTGRVPMEEVRAKLSAAKRNPSPETREKLRQARLGKMVSPETRAKIKVSCKAASATPEVREKLRQNSLGRKHTDEAKRKMSKAKKGRKKSPETITRMKAAAALRWLNKPLSQEVRDRISQTLKNRAKAKEEACSM